MNNNQFIMLFKKETEISVVWLTTFDTLKYLLNKLAEGLSISKKSMVFKLITVF